MDSDQQQQEEDFSKLPLDELVVHKSWKARQCGYIQCSKVFTSLDSKDPQFTKYLGSVKRFAADSNVVALEKGLDALLLFVENASVANKTAGEVCPVLVQKCVGHVKQKIRDKAQEIMLMYVEIEKQDIVIESLVAGLSNKNPKLVSACVSTLCLAVNQFGAKALGGVKNIASQLSALLEHKDPDVREQTKILAIELYRWVGAAFMPLLTGLKQIQKTELEAEFASVKSEGPPVASRYLRSQKAVESVGTEAGTSGLNQSRTGGGVAGPASAETAAVVDPWDFLSPVDVLVKLPKDFYEQLESKKWSERKEPLDKLAEMLKDQRLDTKAQYGEIVAVLKRIVGKDSNIQVVASAGNCLTGLALGLRRKFSNFAPMVAPIVLEKFKEKKPVVVKAMTEAIDAISKTTTFESLLEDILAALDNKSPSIKIQTGLFLSRFLATARKENVPKKVLKLLSTSFIKNISDPDPEVREAAAAALGAAMKMAGEKAFLPFVSEIAEDHLKMDKIKEYYGKAMEEAGAEVVSSMVQSLHKSNNPSVSTTPPKPSASSVRPPGRRTTAGPTTSVPKTADNPPLKVKPGVGVIAKARGSSTPRASSAAKKQQPSVQAGPKVPDEPGISAEEAEEKAESVFPADIRTELESAQWKDRLSGLEKMLQTLKSMPVSDVPCQVTILLLNKKKENNFQVLNQKFLVFAYLVKECNFTACSLSLMFGEVLDKISDGKHSGVCREILTSSAEALGLQFVSEQMVNCVLNLKNPKCQSESLLWLSRAIKEFGIEVNLKQVIDVVQKALAATNPAVRSAAVELAGVLYLFVGARLKTFFEGEKASLFQTLNAEFEKYEQLKAPAPTRRWKLSKANPGGDGVVTGSEEEAVDDDEEVEDNEKAAVADLLPRKDISDQITDDLLEEMANAAWKTRGEALEKVKWILSEAKFITPSLGGLPEALRARLGESNKNLAQVALSICETLAVAVGPRIKEHVRVIGPGIICMLGDSKPTIRQNAVNCLNSWEEQCGFKEFLEGEIFPTAFKKGNPYLTSELFKWMSEKLSSCPKKVPVGDLNLCLPCLYSATEDRNPDVRKQSQDAILPFMKILGYETMLRASNDLKPPANVNVQTLLDKARSQLPVVKSAPATAVGAEGSSRVAATPKSKEPAQSSRPTTARGRSSSRKPGENGRSRKENEESFEGGALIDSGQKQQRFQDEKALKVLKWQFATPDEEHVEQLKNYLSSVSKPALLIQLFHSDFKQHLKAIDALNASIELCPDAVLGASDLLLKWCTLRFFDTNPSVLLKCLDFIKKLLQLHLDLNLELSDFEVSAFVPYLLLKAGEPKEMVRGEVRDILERLTSLYPSSKVFPLVMEGLKTKNSRQKAECLLRIASMIEVYGLSVCGNAQQALKTIAQNIGDRDKDVRNGALTAVVAAYMHAGEKVYRYVGNISEKEYVMLEERIKRSTKNRPLIKKPSPPDDKKVVGRGGAAVQREMNGVADGESDAMEVDDAAPSVGKLKKHRPANYEEIGADSDGGTDYKMPKLIDHAEVNEILSKPVQMPQIRTRGISPAKRRGSVASVTSITSIDASTALDNVISQVTSNSIPTAIQALAQLDELIKDNGKSGVLTGRVDQILISLYFQLRMACSTHMADESVPRTDVIDLYRQIGAMLLSLLQSGDLVREASEGPLKDLACQLLTVLLDERLPNIPEGNQVVKSINILIVKLVDKADATVCLVALMRLLRETLNSQTASIKFQELVMKCIWKHSRQLGVKSHTMQLSKVLNEAHHFFVEFPPAYWRQRPTVSDTPMKTVKTILNTLCRAQRDKILDHVGGIENPQNSEVVAYLRKSLREIAKNPPPPSQNQESMSNGHDNTHSTPSSDLMTDSTYTRIRESSPFLHSTPSSVCSDKEIDFSAALAEIFRKIGDKENSKEGIRELYEFKRSHPKVDISPYLKKTSSFFRSYIERSLQQVETERWNFQRNGTKERSPEVTGSVPSAYLEKLQQVRSRCGLSPSDISVKRTSISEDDLELPQVKLGSGLKRSPAKIERSVEPPPLPRTSSADMEDLKRRLDQIKRGQQ